MPGRWVAANLPIALDDYPYENPMGPLNRVFQSFTWLLVNNLCSPCNNYGFKSCKLNPALGAGSCPPLPPPYNPTLLSKGGRISVFLHKTCSPDSSV